MFWCTFGACCLTAHLIMKHCSNFSNSRQQRCICRILLMVPIYSGDSWLSLRFFRQSVYFDTGNYIPRSLCRLGPLHHLTPHQLAIVFISVSMHRYRHPHRAPQPGIATKRS